jgi:ankyrin repeat protein
MLILLLFFSETTPLHRSAQYGNITTCRLLLQCGADPQAQDVK